MTLSRRKRRLLVAVTYGSYIALCIAPGFARGQAGLMAAAGYMVTAMSGLLLFSGWLALVRLVREYGFPGDTRTFTSHDERQTAVRHHAFVLSYRILTGILSLAAVYWTVAAATALWLPGPEFRSPLLFGLVFLTATMPSATIAWIEPDAI